MFMLQALNVVLSSIIGGTLFWLVLEASRKSYETNLYSSALGGGLLFTLLTYIGYIIYRRVKKNNESSLRKELIFCYILSLLLWTIPVSLTYGTSLDKVTDFALSISIGTLCIPLFKHYVESLFIAE